MALTAQHSQGWKLITEKETDLAIPIFEQALGNQHYQGELGANKTLNIVSPGSVTTNAYTGADITFSTAATTSQTFTCDQKNYFAYQLLHDDKHGSIFDILGVYAKKGAQKLALDVDTYLASLHSSITTNTVGTNASPITVGLDTSAGEMLPSRALARMLRKITEANGDVSNPQVTVPAWFADALLMETSTKLTNRGDQTAELGVAVGKMPILAGGFKAIFVSTAVANTAGTLYKIMAGSPESSITVARAIDSATVGQREANFADYVKALLIFGAKIPKEDNMCVGTFNVGTDGNGNSLAL